MYAFPSDIGDICQSILVQNGQASHVREYVHRVSSNWSLHAPVPFSIFVSQYVSNPLFRTRYYFLLRGPALRSFPFDCARINRLTGISPRESRTGQKDITEPKEYRVGGREKERERVLEKWATDERRGRVTNATSGMHLVRSEWRYCTSTSVIGRSASIANIDKKRVLSIPTNFSFQTLGPRVFAKYISKIYIHQEYIYIFSLLD